MSDGADSLVAIRMVHEAADGLTLACTTIVGAVPMEVGRPMVGVLGEPVPRAMQRRVVAIGAVKKGRKAR